MDPFSITVGAMQIAAACSQCTMTIIKLVEDIKTADQRIRGFYDEVIALSTTYDTLNQSLASPLLTKAAKDAQRTHDTAPLWSQVRVAVDDSVKTIEKINRILNRISGTSGFLRKAKSQLLESLKEGELGRLRQRIHFFNQTISLPIQMVCVMLQLEQKGISNDQQRQLDLKFVRLERTMHELITKLGQPSRSSTMLTGSTLVVGEPDDEDTRGKENYLSFAKKILTTASAAASNRSSLSTVSQPLDNQKAVELGGTIPQRPPDRKRTIDDWRDGLPIPQDSGSSLYQDIASPTAPSETSSIMAKSYDVDFKLTQRYLKLGHEKTEQENHKSAETCYRNALGMLEKHDFSDRIALQPADVVIMLAQSCLAQQKYDDSISLLTPVAEREDSIFPPSDKKPLPRRLQRPPPDEFQALTACHLLGEVYRQKGDFEEAVVHAQKAFLDRTDKLGEGDPKTIESVQLLIDVYRAKGEEEVAEAYEGFLNPAPPEKKVERQSTIYPAEDEQMAAPTVSPPASEFMEAPRRFESKAARQSRTNLTTRIKNFGKPSQQNLQQPRHKSEANRLSFPRSSTIEENQDFSHLPSRERHLSSPSTTSYDRTNSYIEDDSTPPSSTRMDRTHSIKEIEPTFQAVDNLCAEGKHSRAVSVAMSFLESYNSRDFIIRRDAMEKNIRKGDGRGLAATGKGYAPIHYFCDMREEHVEEVRLLLQYGADVNAVVHKAGYTSSKSWDVMTPLSMALDKGHTNIALLLLQTKGIRTDFKDREGVYPLLTACRKRNYPLVAALLDHPQSIPTQFPVAWYGNSLLTDAARHCDLPLVQTLLQRGVCPVNAQDKFGKTPLMYAVIKSDVSDPEEKATMLKTRSQVVRTLLDAGADVNLVDNKGTTARGYADMEMGDDVSTLVAMLGEARFELGT